MFRTWPSLPTMSRRVAAVGLVALALILALPRPLMADGSAGWTLVQAEGDVQIQPVGGGWSPVALSSAVRAGSVLRTGENGRAMLESDGDRIFVSPNSRLELPAGEPSGAATHVRQSLGTMLYDIFTRYDFATPAAERFRVDTPYLAAVIKGTVFTVTVGAEGAAVRVIKGVVQVTSADGAHGAMVYPGETATVPPRADGDVTILGRQASATPGGGTELTQDTDAAIQTDGSLGAGATAGLGGTIPSVGGALPGTSGTLSGVGGTLSGATGTLSGVSGTLSGATGTISGAGGTLSGAAGALSGAGGTLSGATGTLSGLKGALPSISGGGGLTAGKNALGGIAGAIKP